MGWNYFVTRLEGNGSETRIASDVMLNNVGLTYSLSAPNILTAELKPEIPSLLDSKGQHVFVPWSSAVYAEKDGVIRFGGIVTSVEPEDETLKLTVEGFAAYAYDMPYIGEKEYIQADPVQIVKDIWAHLQGQAGGNLGLSVKGAATPVRIGTEPREVEFTTATGEDVSFEAGPYKLNWWSTHDLGGVIDNLAESTPFDYTESHAWDGDNIAHRLDLFFPGKSARRSNLRFAIGENVTAVPRIDQDGDEYASGVTVLGAGEGREMRMGEAVQTPKRLRRVKVITDKSVSSHRNAREIAAQELELSEDPYGTISDLLVMDHPNAPLFSFEPGDEIRVVGDTGWGGYVDMFVKIINITVNTDEGIATLSVKAG